ncbi:sulfopyruvate decarboxylase subunit alpha [Desulfurobacterium sp.]
MEATGFITGTLKGLKIDYVLSLPCDRVKTLLAKLDGIYGERHIHLSREEEGLGIAAGLFAGGKRYALFIQSSGVGNIFGALMTLIKTYRIPLPIFVSHRGIYKEKILPQVLMGEVTENLFKACGVPVVKVYDKSALPIIPKAVEEAFRKREPIAILLSPALFEGEEYKNPVFEKEREKVVSVKVEKSIKNPDMRRFEAVAELFSFLKEKGDKDTVLFANIGFPAREVYHLKNLFGIENSVFYMLGSLGLVSSIALGYSVATGRSVISIDGDGSLLMNTGTLATCSSYAPENFRIFCVDNGTWGSTGDQENFNFSTVDVEVVAKGMGFKNTSSVWKRDGLKEKLEWFFTSDKPFLQVVVNPGNEKVGTIPLSPEEILREVKVDSCY